MDNNPKNKKKKTWINCHYIVNLSYMLGIRLYWLIIVSKRVNLGYVNRIVFDLSFGHKLFKQQGYDLRKNDD